jgi:hypothetical protein
MAITVLSKTQPRPVSAGQEGCFEQMFSCEWSTTDVTGTVPVGMTKVLRMKDVVLLEEPSEGETIYHSGTVNDDGSLVLSTGALLNLGRISFDPTSGLKFSFAIEGYI